VLYQHAQTIIRQFTQAQHEVAHSNAELSGTVRIGLAATVGASLAVDLISATRRTYPKVT